MPDCELSLIFLLSHSRSRAHEGESGKTEAPAKISSFLSLISRGADEGQTTARNLILLLSKKYSAMPKIARIIGLFKSKRTFTRVLLGY